MANFTTVFLSSTAKDLQPWRDAVSRAIAAMDGHHGVRMEDFGARDREAEEACRAQVKAADVFVCLVGLLHGSRPPGSELSYTEIEYDEATKRKKPRLLFVAQEDLPLPGNLRELDEAWQRQKRFREKVLTERVAKLFREPHEVAAMVVAALQTHQAEIARRGVAQEAERGKSQISPSEVALREAYLNRLLEDIGFLDLSGIDPAVANDRNARLRLQAVYTALLTLSPRDPSQPGSETLAPGGEQRAVSVLEELNRQGRLVLLGDPGSGKSTFVNFVALCMAGEMLGRTDANLELLTSPLPQDRGVEGEDRQPWDHDVLFPVRVVLRDFAARGLPKPGERAVANDLWKFLAGELERLGLPEVFPQLRKELLEGRGLMILDGLDEVPDAERRRQQIRQAVEDFSGSLGKSRVLLTSRTYAYQNPEWQIPGFAQVVLAPFHLGQIDRFVGLWYEQMAAEGRLAKKAARGRAELLRRAIFASDRLQGLAQKPLLLTLMVSLHAWRGGSLPERREELYSEAVELLLNTWERRRLDHDSDGRPVQVQASLAEWLKVDRQEVRQVLDAVAFEAHGAQPGLVDTADVDEGKLVGRLLHLSRNPGADAVELLAYLRDRAGLLVERGEGVYTFPHRTFQEYLAACHLTAKNFPKIVARLGREEPERWREVVLLAGAKAARGAVSSIWNLADKLCFREPGASGTVLADDWGGLLAGQALAQSPSADLAEVDEEDVPKLERVQRWLLHLLRAGGFPARERGAAGKAFAALGDSRFDPEQWYLPREPLVGYVKVLGGPFLMGSDETDVDAVAQESPRHEVSLPTYWMARYPVTVGQIRSFVEKSGYEPTDGRSLEGPSNHPVAYMSFYDALAYCRWLEQQLEVMARSRRAEGPPWSDLAAGYLRVSLPSEAEWEKAARGVDGRKYPWGSAADPNRANFNDTGLFEASSVGAFPEGTSPFGCEDMSGNVWEWTRSLWGEKWGEPHFAYPYVERDGREDLGALPKILRVVRGGSFNNSTRGVRCACRERLDPDGRYGNIAFRVVLSPSPLDL